MKKAFTMIEVVFVIVILGILAAVAIPRLATTRTDAVIAKARADVASVRSSIVSERQSRLIKGDSSWISELSYQSGNPDYVLFTGSDVNRTLLMYGISTGGIWAVGTSAANTDVYTVSIAGKTAIFTYYNNDYATKSERGKFTCSTTSTANSNNPELCKDLIN